MAINYPITPDIIMNVSLMLNAINAIKDNWSNSRHYYEHLNNVKFNESSEKWLINVTDTYFPGELEREWENYLVREMSPKKSVKKKPTWISKSGTLSLVTTIDQYSRKSQPMNYKIIKELRPVPQKWKGTTGYSIRRKPRHQLGAWKDIPTLAVAVDENSWCP